MGPVELTLISVLCIACFCTAAFFCLRAEPLCVKLELIDHPMGRKQHRAPTPLMGGLVIALVQLPLSIVCAAYLVPPHLQLAAQLYTACMLAMALLGMADDRHSVSPRLRLVLSIIVFTLTAYSNPVFLVRSLSFEWPAMAFGLGSYSMALAFTVFSCVAFTNAVNMADGKNGLVIGLCIGWLILIGTRMPAGMLPLLGIAISALTALYVFNMYGRLFLGDGGSYGFACAVALFAIACYNSPGAHAGRAMAAEEVVLLFLVPVLDGGRLIVSRVLQGRSPFSPGRDHLHHYLYERFGWPGGLIVYYLVALGPAALLFAVRA